MPDLGLSPSLPAGRRCYFLAPGADSGGGRRGRAGTLGISGRRGLTATLAIAMASSVDNIPAVDKVQALVQLLRTRSSEEIRQRMYDNPPGSPWWTACKTELDVRNGERSASALVDTSRVLEKMRQSAEHLDKLTENLLQSTTDLADLFKGARESGRRLELAVYVILGVTLMQLFYVVFLLAGKR
jgi:hypothetical protein